ncbi:MAG TPA: hypothetical protein VM600_09770, partial [Actinomycetota bacterium]|nr:hypothetical protein [Actinomycetota bacterium]
DARGNAFKSPAVYRSGFCQRVLAIHVFPLVAMRFGGSMGFSCRNRGYAGMFGTHGTHGATDRPLMC